MFQKRSVRAIGDYCSGCGRSRSECKKNKKRFQPEKNRPKIKKQRRRRKITGKKKKKKNPTPLLQPLVSFLVPASLFFSTLPQATMVQPLSPGRKEKSALKRGKHCCPAEVDTPSSATAAFHKTKRWPLLLSFSLLTGAISLSQTLQNTHNSHRASP